ncbi:MAG TPA: VOC family protein [Kineosporiaceae bacterium]|nr:VOC family protein [Kineosporiaceae bacterium]
MPLSIVQIVIDCDDAEKLSAFWSQVLNRPVDEGAASYFATIGLRAADSGPALMFIKVPETKQHKNRVHLDLTGAGWADEVERVIGLGAVRVSEHQEFGTHWVTLRDPEGNEFDIGAGMG